ncbi:MAG: fumarylacetoacetate hydrolase family protein [Kordiimonadaceae bacterium]|nr:fumarylacetoacetate hydrolase family protein [Kordiimonadaceae bacterium]
MTDQIQKAADRLWEASQTGTACAPVRDLIGDMDISAAYQVQDINTERMLAAGKRIIGRKTGLTAKAVQQQLGVDQPDYGILFDDMDISLGQEIPVSRVLQPKVEAEIAFILGDDLNSDRLTTADIMSSVEYAVAAIEVVGSRIAGWDIGIHDTIADNASSGVFVLGDQPHKLENVDLRLCGMVMERRGDPISVGAGIACLGSPIAATLWLANIMATAGRPLRKGDVVLSGALGPMANVEPGDAVTTRINGLGTVSAFFS